MNKYAVIVGLYVTVSEYIRADEGSVIQTDLSFEEACKVASQSMYPVSIVPVQT